MSSHPPRVHRVDGGGALELHVPVPAEVLRPHLEPQPEGGGVEAAVAVVADGEPGQQRLVSLSE